MSTPARPRHSRKEIRNFADELDRGGWTFEDVDASGHTIWSHPRATARFKLPETPKHFDVQRARRDVARLIGEKVPGKRNGKSKPKRQRQDFVLGKVAKKQSADTRPVPTGPAISIRRTPKRLPWENQPDNYDPAIDRLMREAPHR